MVQLLRDTFHLLRHKKLVWIFGFLSVLCSSLPSLSEITLKNQVIQCLYSVLVLAAYLVSIIASGCLVFIVHQSSQHKNPTFAETWNQGKSRFFHIFGLLILSISMPLLAGICSMMISASIPSKAAALPFLWIFDLISNVFYSPLIIFGICAIIIDGLKVWTAAWIGFQITINNFFRVLLVIGVIASIRLLIDGLLIELIATGIIKIGIELPSLLTFDFAAYRSMLAIPIFRIANTVVSLLIIPSMNTFLTLGYLRFTKEIDYPALALRKQPNIGST